MSPLTAEDFALLADLCDDALLKAVTKDWSVILKDLKLKCEAEALRLK